jgi:Zn-dependent membrane protease YugP
MRRAVPWVLTLALTALLAGLTTHQALGRYRALRSGWSWDLAYYNQWFWAISRGDGTLSVRPIGPWTQEGPPVWKMNYLAPIRLAVLPVHALFPDPRTLLVVQAVTFWLLVPAVFGLVRAESGSSWLALSAAALVPLTPLLWPLAWNDFRELQLATPFALWAVHGVRARRVCLTVLGAGGLLACRQEFALLVASLAFLPAQRTEEIDTRFRWAQALWLSGWGWLLGGFLLYARWCVNWRAWEVFLAELAGRRAPILESISTAGGFLFLGMGVWTLLACRAPRAAILAVPWIWSLSSGRWALRFLGTEEWHHVRYTVPMAATVLAAGCMGYARLGGWCLARRNGVTLLGAAWLIMAASSLALSARLEALFAHVPRPISPSEAADFWTWVDRVGPADGVLAHYELAAPLSSRKRLFSYVMEQNYPPGYPQLGPEIQWAFYRRGDVAPQSVTDQGFRLVHDGPHLSVFFREPQQKERAPTGEATVRARSHVLRETAQQAGSVDWVLLLGSGALVLGEVLRTALFLAPALALVIWSRRRVAAAQTFGATDAGITGADAVRAILASQGLLSAIPLHVVNGPSTSYYDPACRSLRLGEPSASGRSVFGLAIAVREAAHAIRHARGDPLQLLRNPLLFALKLGTATGCLLMIAGIALASWQPVQTGALALTATILVTLPGLMLLERDASRFAADLLDRAGLLRPEDRSGVAGSLAALLWAWLANLPRRRGW